MSGLMKTLIDTYHGTHIARERGKETARVAREAIWDIHEAGIENKTIRPASVPFKTLSGHWGVKTTDKWTELFDSEDEAREWINSYTSLSSQLTVQRDLFTPESPTKEPLPETK